MGQTSQTIFRNAIKSRLSFDSLLQQLIAARGAEITPQGPPIGFREAMAPLRESIKDHLRKYIVQMIEVATQLAAQPRPVQQSDQPRRAAPRPVRNSGRSQQENQTTKAKVQSKAKDEGRKRKREDDDV